MTQLFPTSSSIINLKQKRAKIVQADYDDGYNGRGGNEKHKNEQTITQYSAGKCVLYVCFLFLYIY